VDDDENCLHRFQKPQAAPPSGVGRSHSVRSLRRPVA
jgi:hypothetical protein